MSATKMKKVLADRGVDYIDGITDEMVARMDWVASLTDTDIEHIKNGLVLLGRSAEFFHRHIEERAITRLADELEALP